LYLFFTICEEAGMVEECDQKNKPPVAEASADGESKPIIDDVFIDEMEEALNEEDSSEDDSEIDADETIQNNEDSPEDVVRETPKVTETEAPQDQNARVFRSWVDFLKQGGDPNCESFLALPDVYRDAIKIVTRAEGWELPVAEETSPEEAVAVAVNSTVERIESDPEWSSVTKAHNCVAAVLRERSASWPKAFISNVNRDRPGTVDCAAGFALGFGLSLLTGDITLFFATAPAGIFLRNVRRLFRIRGSHAQIGNSKLSELNSFWNLTCYKSVRLSRGFNTRVDAIEILREDGLQLEAAHEWNRLLKETRPALIDARDQLSRLDALTSDASFREELEARVKRIDPLGYGKGNVPSLDWLDLDAEKIPVSLAVGQFESDVESMNELRERYERMQESHAEVERDLEGDKPVYEDLERKHGKAVDDILENKDKDEE